MNLSSRSSLIGHWIIGPLFQGAPPKGILMAVDGGLSCLRGRADFAIGDWDGVEEKESIKKSKNEPSRLEKKPPPTSVHLRTLSPIKDHSDLSGALAWAKSLGWKAVGLRGFVGGRADHQMGVYLDCLSASISISILERDLQVEFLGPHRPSVSFSCRSGETISLFAPSGAQGVRTRGLVFPLRGERLVAGTRGLSNLARSKRVTVSLEKGGLMVMRMGRNGSLM